MSFAILQQMGWRDELHQAIALGKAEDPLASDLTVNIDQMAGVSSAGLSMISTMQNSGYLHLTHSPMPA